MVLEETEIDEPDVEAVTVLVVETGAGNRNRSNSGSFNRERRTVT